MPLIDENLKAQTTDTFNQNQSLKSNQSTNSFNNFNPPPSQGLFHIPEKYLQLIP
jgi:hypothetical protein